MSHPSVAAALQAAYGVEVPAFNLVIAAIAGALGCNLGSEVAYWVGAKGGRPAIERYGRLLLISKHELDLGDRWFAQHGEIIILLARLLPVVRTFIAFPAGIARMNRAKFHVYTFLGSLPWCLALGYAGQRLGLELLDEHSPLKSFMHRFDAVIALGIVVAGSYFVWSRVKVYRQYKLDGGVEASIEPSKVD
jgi:membrane protein DedA with SNARE-associated domain